jgi:hypothetical protein
LRRGSPTDLTVRADRATLSDAAVEFDAADKALLKTASDPAFFTLAGKTVSIWVKLDDSGPRRIFTQDENTLRYDPNEDAFVLDYNGFEDSYKTADVSTLAHVSLTDWVHIVIVARSAGIKIYLNGILDTNDDSEIDVMGFDGSAYQFGGQLNGVWFDGKFDSSAIWTREFTDAEVLQLYNDGAGFTYSQLPANLATGILHAWDFSARSSTGVWFDAVGGANLTEEFDNKVTNGDFAVDTGWTVNDSWLIQNGQAIYFDAITDYTARVVAAGGDVLAPESIKKYFFELKLAGIWDKLKSSALFAGVDFDGCFVPLRSDMPTPTNVNFTSSEHNSVTGLVGDGSSMHINTNRNNNADSQDSQTLSAYITAAGSGTTGIAGCGLNTIGASHIHQANSSFDSRSRNNSNNSTDAINAFSFIGFIGISRTQPESFRRRIGPSVMETIQSVSQSPLNANHGVFVRLNTDGSVTGNRYNGRLATYTIGSGLTDTELAALDTLQTQLLADIAAELA